MDKVIEKKRRPLKQWVIVGTAAVFTLAVGWQVLSRAGSSRLSVDSTRVTTAVVKRGEFLEYYPFDGTVEPATSVYLDVDEGGRVDEIFVEGGAHIKKGDLILRFSNATMQRNSIDTETQLLENLNIQRDAEFNRAQSTLVLKDALLDLDHQILDMEKKYRRYEALMKDGSNVLSQETFETARDELQYLKDKRALMAERIRQEDILSRNQIAQTKASIERLNTSLDLLDRIVKSLEVRAPIRQRLCVRHRLAGPMVRSAHRDHAKSAVVSLIQRHADRMLAEHSSGCEVSRPRNRIHGNCAGHAALPMAFSSKIWRYPEMKIYGSLIGATLLGAALSAHADNFPRLDEAYPANVSINSLYPVFDFDTDGCLPSAGISRTGAQNGGLSPTGSVTGSCRSSTFLDTSNTLHRYACVASGGNTYCGHFFALYFLKDQISSLGGGHRHDWEYAAVWTTNGVITHGGYSQHGDLINGAAADIPFENGHLKIVYHKDGVSTHVMRFASSGETAENPYGAFVTPTIISWYTMTGDGVDNATLRSDLNADDFGSAIVPMKDSNFLDNLNTYKPSGYPTFTQASLDASL